MNEIKTILIRVFGFPGFSTGTRSRRKAFSAGLLLKFAGFSLLKAALYLHGALVVFTLIMSLLYSVVNPPTTSLIMYRRLFFNYKTKTRVFVPLDKIPKSVRRMFIKVEDYKFYEHPGIDPEAIMRAFEVNKTIGYNLYGGSTITMQLARTLFLIPKKSYLRKYVEVIVALEMDLVMKKDRILELYINNIEWGKGVYGIGAASQHHYGKKTAALTTDEYRRLVTILTNPLKYNVDTFWKSRGMVERYFFLLTRFP
jgi:monofunctional glycosyltransferase